MTPRKAEFWEWAGGFGLLLAGGLSLCLAAYTHLYGATAESELLYAEGVPEDAVEESSRKSHRLYFRLGGHSICYPNDRPRYDEVRNALVAGRPVRIWVAPRAVVHERESAELWKLSAGERTVLSYADSLGLHHYTILLFASFGTLLFAGGVWSLRITLRETSTAPASASNPPPPTETAARSAEARSRLIGTVVCSVLLAVLVFVPMTAEADKRFLKAFGNNPWGLSAYDAYLLAAIPAFLPLPWFIWCGIRLMDQARHDGTMIGWDYLQSVGSLHPHLKAVQIGVFAGIAWVVLGFAGFVAFVAIRGG